MSPADLVTKKKNGRVTVVVVVMMMMDHRGIDDRCRGKAQVPLPTVSKKAAVRPSPSRKDERRRAT